MEDEAYRARAGNPELEALRFAHNALHERVFVPVSAPSRIRHCAYLLSGNNPHTRERVRETYQRLLRELGVAPDTVRRGERAGSLE